MFEQVIVPLVGVCLVMAAFYIAIFFGIWIWEMIKDICKGSFASLALTSLWIMVGLAIGRVIWAFL